jgi:hypothetical protein
MGQLDPRSLWLKGFSLGLLPWRWFTTDAATEPLGEGAAGQGEHPEEEKEV